jgi:pyridoxamine 5'-phosphate oxidase family protein
MIFSEAELRYVAEHRVGRLATVAPDGTPHNKPVSYHFNADLGTFDIHGFGMEKSAKYRNVATHPAVALVIDDRTGDGPFDVRMLEIRGRAEQTEIVHGPDAHPGASPHIIRIHPRRVISLNIDPDHGGFYGRDVIG